MKRSLNRGSRSERLWERTTTRSRCAKAERRLATRVRVRRNTKRGFTHVHFQCQPEIAVKSQNHLTGVR